MDKLHSELYELKEMLTSTEPGMLQFDEKVWSFKLQNSARQQEAYRVEIDLISILTETQNNGEHRLIIQFDRLDETQNQVRLDLWKVKTKGSAEIETKLIIESTEENKLFYIVTAKATFNDEVTNFALDDSGQLQGYGVQDILIRLRTAIPNNSDRTIIVKNLKISVSNE